jgi:transposase-like protein
VTVMAKYNQYTADFKMKVALEAAQDSKGISDIAGKYQIHHRQVQDWKQRLLENADLVFEKRAKQEEETAKREGELLKKIGQLSVENDWLKKKLEKLKLETEEL